MPTLNWIGKDKVINHHLEVPYRVLEHSYGFKLDEEGHALQTRTCEETGSGNKIIHGDNLEALKSLLPEYEGNIKCISIDPPYNTGNEKWVYNDNVNDPKLKKWLHKVVGSEGEDLSRHDKWLCMMYPRLKLLHKLLADDGAIFINIDDNEQANLKLICDEIFGAGNYLGNLIWRKKEGGGQTDKYFVTEHEYIAVYQKSNNYKWIDSVRIKTDKDFKKVDDNGRFKLTKLEKWGSGARKEDRPSMCFPILTPDNNDYYPIAPDGNAGRWRVGKIKMDKLIKENLIHWEQRNGKYIPYEKTYQIEHDEVKVKERSILYNLTNTTEASKVLTTIFGKKDSFDTPKPYQLTEFVIKHSTELNSIILDSFSGSGTTAHAVLNMNQQDGGNRKFILVESEDYAETITAERVRRVIKGYGDTEGLGGSFDFYELGEPLFNENGDLNESVGIEKIRNYIYYTETKSIRNYELGIRNKENEYFLGKYNDTGYYFYYEKDRVTTLNHAFLSKMKTKSEQYVIYADNCVLTKEYMAKRNIIFKKIPRDITRF